MKCHRCQHDNPQGARFCEECATPLARVCSNCGTALSATAKFCHACAHPMAAGAGAPSRSPDSYTPKHLAERIINSRVALDGDRKQITVLFADLKGLMELADRSRGAAQAARSCPRTDDGGPPSLRGHRQPGDGRRDHDAVRRALAHEDNAVQPCYATLRMQESVSNGEGIRRSHAAVVQVRVGVNSGEAIVRTIGNNLRMDYTAVGQAPNGIEHQSNKPTGGAMKWLSARLLILLFTAAPVHAATIQVNTTQQGVTNGQCSLQEAIYASRFQANTALSSIDPETFYTTGCAAGTGDDRIVLPAGAVFTFDHPRDDDRNIFGPTATPVIFSKITIEGNGATLQWVDAAARPRYSRLFVIPPWIVGELSLTLRNVYIKGFHMKGGNGGPGGGGGLGAGGAIYVSGGHLTVENSTFENNGAIGGNGAGGFLSSGGGGGLSGNGGRGCEISGGGGGGSRGDGGNLPMGLSFCLPNETVGGGGGGGTISSGANAVGGTGGKGGIRWGGDGGDAGKGGHEPPTAGGGGGGGGGIGIYVCGGFFQSCSGNGADGSYGGGGGGGPGNGGNGGFGGGGGGAFSGSILVRSGGDGGFGGGGGSLPYPSWLDHQGKGGPFGGDPDGHGNGGGGGALGGAVFNDNGVVRIRNSTFYNNYVTRGAAGGGSSENGADAGGAIFSLNRALEVTNSTFSGNQATGSGAAIVVYRDDHAGWGSGGSVYFSLYNTIIANNGANECFFTGNVTAKGAGNLIMNNGSGTAPFSPCPGVVTTSDPQLQPLQLNSPGHTPTMAITSRSPAASAADPATSLTTDQRYVARPQGATFDIGAFEVGF